MKITLTSPSNIDRPGLSLLEIIIALSILVASATIVAQMVSVGSQHAARSVEITEAQTIAHNVLNELLAGIRPWQSSETPEPVDSWSSWDHRVTIEPVGIGHLSSVTVSVLSRPDERAIEPADASDDLQRAEPRERFRLTRWIRRDSQQTSNPGATSEFVTPMETD